MASSDAHSVMASVAARLMGRKPATPPQAPASSPSTAAATPRTMPAPQLTAPANKAAAPAPTTSSKPAPAKKENVPPPQPMEGVKQTATPAAQEEDVKMQDVDRGPSLFGTAEQLAVSPHLGGNETLLTLNQAAREFSQTATQGGKSRPPSRKRMLSSKDDMPLSRTSSRSSTAAASLPVGGGYPPLSATSRNNPAPRSQSGSLAASPSSNPSRPAAMNAATPSTHAMSAKPSPSAQPKAPAWSAFAANPTVKQDDRDVDKITKAVEKVEIGGDHPSTAAQDKKSYTAKPANSWQRNQAINTLKNIATEARTPPHLLAKANGAGIARNPIVADDVVPKMAEAANTLTNGESTLTCTTDNKVATFKEQDNKPTSVKAPESKPSALNGTNTPSNNPLLSSAQANTPTVNGDNTLATLNELKETLAVMTSRVAAVEKEHLTLQKQLEKMLQAEERRKYLGTDSAKVPFGIDVQSRKSSTYLRHCYYLTNFA